MPLRVIARLLMNIVLCRILLAFSSLCNILFCLGQYSPIFVQ